MKAIISTTYDDKYLYFLPIVTWCWNKLGVNVFCFMPSNREYFDERLKLILDTCGSMRMALWIEHFDAPEHKEATYAQCSRLYAACLRLPEDEILVTSDIDMAVFKVPPYIDGFTILGIDLVPDEQVPMCYISATVRDWRKVFDLKGKTYQQKLDELLGHIECESFRGNYWGKDQEEAYNRIYLYPDNIIRCVRRTNGQNQFATKRYDRDDSYILERLNPDTIDFHMNRTGFEENNFNIILAILKYHYPNEDFGWLISYNEQYKQLL